MTARIQNMTSQPDLTTGVQHLFKAVHAGGVPPQTLELVHLRASQINGCSFCVDAGATSATKAGVSPEKLLTLAASTFLAWGVADLLSGILERPRLKDRSPGRAFREDIERRQQAD